MNRTTMAWVRPEVPHAPCLGPRVGGGGGGGALAWDGPAVLGQRLTRTAAHGCPTLWNAA